MDELDRTPLHDLHLSLGAKMVPFAGYDMPVQYKLGVMKEHLHTRAAAGLFDVSHMGQVMLHPKSGEVADAAAALETLVPVSVLGLKPGRQRYGLFTNDAGGILDDLMIANAPWDDALFLVVNAACKQADIAHMRAHLSESCEIEVLEDRALLALQGPEAETALARLVPGVADMRFMDSAAHDWDGEILWISRSGYTGEDGFEVSIPAARAEAFATALLEMDEVEAIGLGARDSLRLEAGLCLYGHDLDETTTPVAGGLVWAIQKVRRADGDRAGGFPGAEKVLAEIATGADTLRVGLKPEGRAPMREGVPLFETAEGGAPVGRVTSGGFGPSVGGPVAMGYVPNDSATPGTRFYGEVRGKRLPVEVVALPFVKQSYKR
ncbi:MAG: glycine cleavage system aminomethyltransferase T [Rhodobacteraceae bacterium]|jgi:aminomethyltransferase|uniref:aminomethyltransferase n=1 Tax=Salipiger profundus TaxID=1229727 RepID=A0A1U7D376_9RHOB|nr:MULTISPECIES: glycine cleavage system aminomethyltransferase GcvT [Salipiger]APX22601.1 aminomethyltransferase [Salipiger profundus]MAB05990.1 glycine cleavage system aminomethyltransferase T [Paracoccaceae bacterium]GGA11000.1 aminomethyltransferase [Salipiger profundus]SFC67638.1 aminomethyltransferase [Salipiger profundus]